MDDWSSPESHALPDDLVGFVKPELQPGERLLWVARAHQAGSTPRQGGYWVAGAWAFGLLAAGVVLLALSIRAEAWVRRVEAGLVGFGLGLGILGTLIAFGTVAGLISAWRDRCSRSRRVYAVTDRRAIVWSPVAGSQAVTVQIFPRGSIKPEQIERIQFPDGSGTLSIQGPYTLHGKFEGIADVRRVEDLVRRFLVAPGPGPTP